MPQAEIAKRTQLLEDLVMGVPKHETGRHVLDPDELQIARVIVDMRVAQPAGSSVGLVVHDRIRHVATLPTRKLRPEAQVGVFIVEKEIFIQKSDLVEHSPAIQRPGAAGSENELGIGELRALGAQAAIEADGRRRQAVARAIDAGFIVKEKLRDADAHFRILAHRLQQIFQPPIVRARIVIGERDKLPGRRLQSFGIAAGEAGIFPETFALDNGLHLVEFEFDLTFGFRVASPFVIEIIPLRFRQPFLQVNS